MTYENKINDKYTIIPDEISRATDLYASSKILYGVIHQLARQKKYCYASLKYLAKEAGISYRYARELLKDLEEKDYLTYDKEYEGGKLNIYPFYVTWGKEKTPMTGRDLQILGPGSTDPGITI